VGPGVWRILKKVGEKGRNTTSITLGEKTKEGHREGEGDKGSYGFGAEDSIGEHVPDKQHVMKKGIAHMQKKKRGLGTLELHDQKKGVGWGKGPARGPYAKKNGFSSG